MTVKTKEELIAYFVARSGCNARDVFDLIDSCMEEIRIVTKTGAYTIQPTDEIIRCDGTFTVTLPTSTGHNKNYTIINVGTGTITIAVTGDDTINGTAPNTITTLRTAWYLDGAAGNWDSNN